MPRLLHDTELAKDLARRAARELEERLGAGEALTVESLQAAYPTLWNSAENVLELILLEYDTLLRLGKNPARADYYTRFPQWRERLEKLFGIHDLIANETDQTVLGDEDAVAEGGVRPDLASAGFDVLEEIGRGGMGIVYKARQRGLNRVVALKVMHAGSWATAEQRDRFRQEAEVVARLQHPNIVQVFEFGECNGQLFLALEFVAGASLEQFLSQQHSLGHGGWSPAQAAKVVATLARAVHFAHTHGVVHRDLKPANILLDGGRVVSGEPSELSTTHHSLLTTHQPKITDFGLARLVDADALKTASGAILGTPSYMAPEQTAGNQQTIAAATDVFALGVILYELLTGRLPFQGGTVVETLEQVRNADPVAPRRLRPRLPRDLETICLKCLHKEPDRRYASAQALADDLDRFRAGKPILARPTTALERVVKWIRRRPFVSALLAVILLGTLTSIAVISWELRITVKALADRNDALGREKDEREKAEAGFAAQTIALARAQWTDMQIDEARRTLELCSERFRDEEWRFLDRSCRARQLRIGRSLFGELLWTADGKCLLCVMGASADRWNAETGEKVQALQWHPPSGDAVYQAVASADGRMIHVYGGERVEGQPYQFQPRLVAFDFAQRTVASRQLPVPAKELAAYPYRLRFDPQFRTCAFAANRADAAGTQTKLIDVASDTTLLTFAGSETKARTILFFNSDGALLGQLFESIGIWETKTGSLIKRLDPERGRALLAPQFSADGGCLLYFSYQLGSAERRKKLHVWDRATDREVQTFDLAEEPEVKAILSPDGAQVAWACQATQIVVADVATGRLNRTLRGHRTVPHTMAFSPDGRRLASGSDGVYVWDVTPLPPATE